MPPAPEGAAQSHRTAVCGKSSGERSWETESHLPGPGTTASPHSVPTCSVTLVKPGEGGGGGCGTQRSQQGLDSAYPRTVALQLGRVARTCLVGSDADATWGWPTGYPPSGGPKWVALALQVRQSSRAPGLQGRALSREDKGRPSHPRGEAVNATGARCPFGRGNVASGRNPPRSSRPPSPSTPAQASVSPYNLALDSLPL